MSDLFIYTIISITLFFAGFALAYVFRLSWGLRKEKCDFQLLQEKLQTLKSQSEVDGNVYLDLLPSLSGESDIYKITEAIISAKKNETKIKESLIEELIHSFRSGDIHFIRKITGFLILIGLIGTLAGLSFGLKDIDIANIYDSKVINTFLGHISNALSSSMVAVLSTVILIIFTHIFYEKRRDNLENEVSLFFRLQLIPYLYPEEMKLDDLSQIKTFMNTFAISANKMMEISAQNMKEFQKSSTDLLNAILLNNGQINRLQSSIKDVYEPFTEITKVQQQIAAISVSINDSVNQSKDISKSSKDLIEELKTASTDIIQSVKQTDNKIDQQTNDVSRLILEMRNVVNELKGISGSYNDLLPQFKLINASSSQYLTQMNANFTQIVANIETKFLNTINSIQNATATNVIQPLEDFVDTVLPALKQLISEFTKVLPEINDLKMQTEKQTSSFLEELKSITSSLENLIQNKTRQNQAPSRHGKKNKNDLSDRGITVQKHNKHETNETNEKSSPESNNGLKSIDQSTNDLDIKTIDGAEVSPDSSTNQIVENKENQDVTENTGNDPIYGGEETEPADYARDDGSKKDPEDSLKEDEGKLLPEVLDELNQKQGVLEKIKGFFRKKISLKD